MTTLADITPEQRQQFVAMSEPEPLNGKQGESK